MAFPVKQDEPADSSHIGFLRPQTVVPHPDLRPEAIQKPRGFAGGRGVHPDNFSTVLPKDVVLNSDINIVTN